MLLSPTGTQYLVGTPNGVLDGFVRRRVRVANLVFKITLSQVITLTLLLVCSFSPRVHSIPRGPRIFARNDIKCVTRNGKNIPSKTARI